MKRNAKILDCTLRDGGRVIDCAFPQFHIEGIIRGLAASGIDIVEMGFLRGNTAYKGNSTFFADMGQARACIPENAMKYGTEFVLFADHGAEYSGWDFGRLPPCDGKTVAGIRLGVRKHNFGEAVPVMRKIKELGYRLYIQMVETRNYAEDELLRAIDRANEIGPCAIGIVDTFGKMYLPELERYYRLVDGHLDRQIAIDFHTHNNMQLSFSFAQAIVGLSGGKRDIVLDATLDGMGKGAGNLNTELIVDFLNSEKGYGYDFDGICDAIDEHIAWIKESRGWGYSVPSLLSGVFSSHPNNVRYLLEKNRLKTKDIRHILAKVDPETRKRYDYGILDRAYLEYSSTVCDDGAALELLKEALRGRPVLAVVFGATSRTCRDAILRHIERERPVTISVNHVYRERRPDFVFYGNQRRYENEALLGESGDLRRIVTSNVAGAGGDARDIVVDYNKVVSIGYPNYDNSTIMLLNLLRNAGVAKISIAGLDGYGERREASFSDEVFSHNAPGSASGSRASGASERNREMAALLARFRDTLSERHSVEFVTPSRFSAIFGSSREYGECGEYSWAGNGADGATDSAAYGKAGAFAGLKLLVLDVDGTLTDGALCYGDGNVELKAFSARDGAALKPLPKLGAGVVFLTGRESEAVARRAADLGAVAVQNARDKAAALRALLAERGVAPERAAYIGDDLNDCAAMSLCGWKACPADAAAEIKAMADYVSPFPGGRGAVRDCVEKLLKDCGRWGELLAAYGIRKMLTKHGPL
ncbi:MAG: HAD hydrolase family protein [Clostridiales bacterium]|nr:HAD hydrolase family protein [Clostridiales bacterium]